MLPARRAMTEIYLAPCGLVTLVLRLGRYCKCFRSGNACGVLCTCSHCENGADRERSAVWQRAEAKRLPSAPPADVTGSHLTTPLSHHRKRQWQQQAATGATAATAAAGAATATATQRMTMDPYGSDRRWEIAAAVEGRATNVEQVLEDEGDDDSAPITGRRDVSAGAAAAAT